MEQQEKKRVLLADDDLVVSGMVSEILLSEGFDVAVAHDGEQALDMAKKHVPHIFVFDVMMPKKTGPELLAELRREEWAKSIPAILLTNISAPDIAAHELAHDARVTFLLKVDVTIEDIVAHIKKKLAEN